MAQDGHEDEVLFIFKEYIFNKRNPIFFDSNGKIQTEMSEVLKIMRSAVQACL